MGKNRVPVKDTPQSIEVVEQDFIQDIGAQTIEDALGYSSGVFAEQFGFDARVDTVSVRGLDASRNLDGLRSIHGFYNSARTNPYALERIEVLNGPSSVLYGQSVSSTPFPSCHVPSNRANAGPRPGRSRACSSPWI